MEKNINELSFRERLQEAVESGKKVSLRADPIITSTDSTVINKTVFPGVDILTSPAESFLFNDLGVTRFSGLTGNFVVPNMAEDTGAFYVEWGSDFTVDACAASASMATASLTLAPRRVSHTQSISKEVLAQTSPGIYNSIVQNLQNGLWNAVTADLFKNVRVDCASSNEIITTPTTTALSWTHIVNMEASLGGKLLAKPAYVTTPAVRAYLTTTAKMTNQGPIYENGKINSYPAFAVPAELAKVITFADWSKACVGQWGPIDLVIDPYVDAKKGLINLTISGLFDTGVYNKRAFTSRIDVSIG